MRTIEYCNQLWTISTYINIIRLIVHQKQLFIISTTNENCYQKKKKKKTTNEKNLSLTCLSKPYMDVIVTVHTSVHFRTESYRHDHNRIKIFFFSFVSMKNGVHFHCICWLLLTYAETHKRLDLKFIKNRHIKWSLLFELVKTD